MLGKLVDKTKLVLPMLGLGYFLGCSDDKIEEFVKEAPKIKTRVEYPVNRVDLFYRYEDSQHKGDALLSHFRKAYLEDNNKDDYTIYDGDFLWVRDLDGDGLVGVDEFYD